MALLYVCSAVHDEVERLLYSENRFVALLGRGKACCRYFA